MKKALLPILFCLCSLFGSCQSICPTYSSNYVPKDLTDALEYLNCTWTTKNKEDFKKSAEEDLSVFHFGAALNIRNRWGLWQGSNELVKYFNGLGIHHPDDMSGIILRSFHRKLNDKEMKLEEQVAYYKAYLESFKKQEELLKIKPCSL